MSLPSSRSSSALVVALSVVLYAGPAFAQACCAGANAITPGRLALHEDYLVALQVRGAGVLGAWDGTSHFTASPSGAREADFEQDAIVTVRLFERAQATLIVPLVETWRTASAISEGGGGIGDVQVGARYDFVLAGERLRIPGIAVMANVTIPSGTATERATNTLATDATGIGFWRLAGALALEQQFGHVLVNITGTLAWAAPRTLSTFTAQDGLQWSVFGAAGWVFHSSAALALTASYTDELAGTVAGMRVDGSGRAALRLGLAGGTPITDNWRISAGLYSDIAAASLGRSQPAQLGLTFLLVRSWS